MPSYDVREGVEAREMMERNWPRSLSVLTIFLMWLSVGGDMARRINRYDFELLMKVVE
jgi:hypothetical protein